MPLQVTPSDQAGHATRERARRLGRLAGFRYVARKEVDWDQMVLVVGRVRMVVRDRGRDFGWHRGLLHTRLEAGGRHPLIKAVGATDRVLDLTLGFGTDAMFLVRALGARVVGVEASPVLALLAGEGLRAEPIRVVCAEGGAFLSTLPDRCFDLVYADPLFGAADASDDNPSLALVRRLGVRSGVDRGVVAEALRVAARVVVKDAPGGSLLEELGAPRIEGMRRTRYGIWEA